MDSYFSIPLQLLIGIAFLLITVSVFYFELYNNKNRAIFILVLGSICLKLFMILLAPYLFAWDEVFHGLVAKNMVANPFSPELYHKTFFKLGLYWGDTTIWVHKQPWFLWQMALSIKVFGASAFAVRLPSLIYMCLSVFFIYDIGKKITNERIGFYAALFFSLNNHINDFVSGRIATDHNDVVFMGLIIASFWAFVNYVSTEKKFKYVILIGVFCGLAILTKWLVALIIFFCWFIYIISNNKAIFYKISLYYDFLKSLIIALVISMPWQIYIMLRYPAESSIEYDFNKKHITEALEGHAGDSYFYVEVLKIQYGYLAPLFCLVGIVLLYRYMKERTMYLALISSFVFIYLFFTFVQTKMLGFTTIVSFIVFLGFGAIANRMHDEFFASHKFKKFLFIGIVLFFGFLSFNIEDVQEKFTSWKVVEKDLFYLEREENNKETAELINSIEKDKTHVLFNCDFPGNISYMFETGLIAYSRPPSSEDVKVIKDNGYKVGIINTGLLPPEIENNSDFKIYSIDKFTLIRKDTLYLKSVKFGYFSNSNDKLTTDSVNKTKLVFSLFKDGKFQIKTINNTVARIDYGYGGLITLNGKIYNSTSSFKFEFIEKNTFRIKTFENKYLKTNINGERIISDKLTEEDDFKFQLSRY